MFCSVIVAIASVLSGMFRRLIYLGFVVSPSVIEGCGLPSITTQDGISSAFTLLFTCSCFHLLSFFEHIFNREGNASPDFVPFPLSPLFRT